MKVLDNMNNSIYLRKKVDIVVSGEERAEYNMRPEKADLEREKVIKKIREMEQQEQKERNEEEGNMLHTNAGRIHFDFIDLGEYSARKETVPENSDSNTHGDDTVFSDDTVSEDAGLGKIIEISQGQAAQNIQLVQPVLDDNNELPSEDALLSLKREHPAEEIIYPAEKKGKSIYQTDRLFAPMLKRAEGISLLDFLVDNTEEELAVSVDNELYINSAASIRLLVKAGHASLYMNRKEAGRLWGTVCFYSIDAGYTNMAFWNLTNVVYKSDSAKAKAILKVIIKKEQKLMQIINECLNDNREKGE